MNREMRTQIAQQTLEIMKQGHYINPTGAVVDISAALTNAIAQARLYRPADFPATITGYNQTEAKTLIEVTEETTLQASQRLRQAHPTAEIVALNFASARKPGGGFLSGSQAQEESIARSSGLYPTIVQMSEFYDYHNRESSCLYSDYMIYSPQVPIFKDDNGQLLPNAYLVSIITSPAVNAGAIKKNTPREIKLIRPTMADRIAKVLWVAAQQQQTHLILGAWGCGVFGNDPTMIAELFEQVLQNTFAHYFKQIVFAIPNFEMKEIFQKTLLRS